MQFIQEQDPFNRPVTKLVEFDSTMELIVTNQINLDAMFLLTIVALGFFIGGGIVMSSNMKGGSF